MPTPRLGLALPVGVALLLAGCGKPPPRLYPVAGKVLADGKPVPAGTVQFRADGGKGNKTMDVPVGEIGPDGSFELRTNGEPGAPAGWYRVLVVADNFKVVDPPPSAVWPNYPEGFLPKPRVHERYLYFNKTDLSVEVVENPGEKSYVLSLNP